MERERKGKKLKNKLSTRGRRPKMGARVTKEPKVDPAKRVMQFPDHSLRVSNHKLYCDCCSTELSMRKISVSQHIKGKFHLEKYELWVKKLQHQEATINLLARERNANQEDRGGCVRPEVQEFRYATVRTFMGLGIPLTKIDKGMGALLSRTGFTLGGASDLASQYVTLVRNAEIDLVREELNGQWVTIIFDGTTRVGEALAVVARFCTADFRITYRLLALKTAEKHMTGAEMSGLLLRLLVQRVGPTAFDQVIAIARDSCATNGVAVRSLKLSAMPAIQDVMCFSHTLHNCAKHMNLKSLEAWLTLWLTLMSHSHTAKQMWANSGPRESISPRCFSVR